VVLAVLATAFWVMIVVDGNYCWDAFIFTMMTIAYCTGTLLFGVIPSSVLYYRERQRGDLISLLLTGFSFATILAEAILLLWIIPMRGE